jgi:hypothetical protein
LILFDRYSIAFLLVGFLFPETSNLTSLSELENEKSHLGLIFPEPWPAAFYFQIQGYLKYTLNYCRFVISLKEPSMEIIYDLVKILVPSGLVLITAWVLISKMIKNDQDRRRNEIVLMNSRTVLPVRLQAYERIIMFLERISMESLLVRVNRQGMTAGQLHSTLLTTIRSEFEHNLSQQIYMTPQVWEVIKNARSNTIKIINSIAEAIPESATSVDLSRTLLEKVMELEKEPTQVAIEFVKAEIARLL